MSARRNLFPDFPPEEDGLLNAVMDTIEALPNLDDVFDMEENHAMDEWESEGEEELEERNQRWRMRTYQKYLILAVRQSL